MKLLHYTTLYLPDQLIEERRRRKRKYLQKKMNEKMSPEISFGHFVPRFVLG